MVVLENLASTLQGLFVHAGNTSEWRVLGQERDGGLLVSWLVTNPPKEHNAIGIYYRSDNNFEVLYEFDGRVNVVQASINKSKTTLIYVHKISVINSNDGEGECCNNESKDKNESYKVFLVQLKELTSDDVTDAHCQLPSKPLDLGIERSLQIVGQFLYCSKDQPGDPDRFLVLIHHESVSLYHFRAVCGESDAKILNIQSISQVECVVRSFTWAQWDPVHQCLFYIHFRKPVACLVEGDEEDISGCSENARRQDNELAPTLSGLQFHDSMPHETVLNIPLNLPFLPNARGPNCFIYEDDPIPLRVHDCSLDLVVLSDPRGIVCICHHYLYQPVKPCSQSPSEGPGKTVHFAYSVTLLHHGCVLHCVAPGIPWDLARKMRPSFALYGDEHMVVHAPGLFTHLLDVGMAHEPCCHILLDGDALTLPESACLAPLLPSQKHSQCVLLDLASMDIVPVSIAPAHLLRAFRGGPHGSSSLPSNHKNRQRLLDNQLAILHYVVVHLGNNELLLQLLNCIASQCMEFRSHLLLEEILVGGAYAAAQKNLPCDAGSLLPLLPLTVSTPVTQQNIKVSHSSLSLTQETLWNTAMMLLSPQQRLIPYRCDMWTRLYESLAASQQRAASTATSMTAAGVRFRPCHVADKLMVSLICYQPEALSRCSTPLSPGGSLVVSGAAFSDVVAITGANKKGVGLDALPFQESESCTASKQEHVISVDEEAQIAAEDDVCSCPICEPDNAVVSLDNVGDLPFFELDSCTASKQELVISVNLRELSMHLLKHALRGQSPLHVHAVATRYVAAQLDMSRSLCRLLCLAAKLDPRQEPQRGFPLVDQLNDAQRRLIFWLFERFLLATESLAFPLPQGFTSFFTYLGYRTLSFPLFMQYAQRHAFELQVDVMKVIMSDTPEGSSRKLRLLQLLPRSRAKRLLNAWPHALSLMLRAREHALHVLSGVESTRGSRGARPRPKALVNRGLAAFPSHDRLSPLDTFLDLLTAKASLAELDFGLLIEATIASTEEIN